MEINQEAQLLIAQDFELEKVEGIDFIQQLADKIAYMLEHNPDLLFSYFYRLDIDEHKIESIIFGQNPIPVNIQLAHLVLDRQIQRAETKRKYKPDTQVDWME
jgi:hypothetical protein